MDGHDNDAEKAAGNSETQGIFSTPDLTVDAEKIAPSTTDDNRSRVASIFANTEAGQQSQRLNDAMEANVIKTAPANTEIPMNNSPRKRSKIPIVVALVALLAVVGGLITWSILRNNTPNVSTNPQEAFAEYQKLLKDGPNNIEIPEDDKNAQEWFVSNVINNSILTNSEQVQYLSDLQDKFKTFKELADQNDSNSEILTKEIDYYAELLDLISNLVNLSDLSQELLNIYLEKDTSAAVAYINDVTKNSNSEYSTISTNNALIKDYLTKHLSIIQIYDNYKCITDNQLDYACGMEKGEYSTALDQAQGEQNQLSRSLQRNLPQLLKNLIDSTSMLSGLLGNTNE